MLSIAPPRALPPKKLRRGSLGSMSPAPPIARLLLNRQLSIVVNGGRSTLAREGAEARAPPSAWPPPTPAPPDPPCASLSENVLLLTARVELALVMAPPKESPAVCASVGTSLPPARFAVQSLWSM